MDTTQPTVSRPAQESPLEVQNIEVKAGKVKSRIGFTAMIVSLLLWLIAILLVVLFFDIVAAATGDASTDLKETLVLVISFGIPLAGLFAFALYRLNKIIAEDAQTLDDVFFRKSVRANLFFAIFLSVPATGIAIYNIAASTILQNKDITLEGILDAVVFAALSIIIALFFWSYQRRTTK